MPFATELLAYYMGARFGAHVYLFGVFGIIRAKSYLIKFLSSYIFTVSSFKIFPLLHFYFFTLKFSHVLFSDNLFLRFHFFIIATHTIIHYTLNNDEDDAMCGEFGITENGGRDFTIVEHFSMSDPSTILFYLIIVRFSPKGILFFSQRSRTSRSREHDWR